jgi:putative transposase
VAESFFSNLKKERIRGKTYRTREEARLDVFDYFTTGNVGTLTLAA